MIRNMSVSSDASTLKDPEVAFSLATSVSLLSDKEAFRVETDLNATALASQSALLVHSNFASLYPNIVEVMVLNSCFADRRMDSRYGPSPSRRRQTDWSFTRGS